MVNAIDLSLIDKKIEGLKIRKTNLINGIDLSLIDKKIEGLKIWKTNLINMGYHITSKDQNPIYAINYSSEEDKYVEILEDYNDYLVGDLFFVDPDSFPSREVYVLFEKGCIKSLVSKNYGDPIYKSNYANYSDIFTLEYMTQLKGFIDVTKELKLAHTYLIIHDQKQF